MPDDKEKNVVHVNFYEPLKCEVLQEIFDDVICQLQEDGFEDWDIQDALISAFERFTYHLCNIESDRDFLKILAGWCQERFEVETDEDWNVVLPYLDKDKKPNNC